MRKYFVSIAILSLYFSPATANEVVEPVIDGAIYQSGNYAQNVDVRFQSITGTGCNLNVTVSNVTETYYAPPLQKWGKWQTINVGFLGPIAFSVNTRVVGDCKVVGEVRYSK